MADELVRMSGIVKTVPGNARLLHEVDLTIEAGSSTAIVGRSGSGKSTLLSVLALLDTAESGTYAFHGRDVATMSLREREALRGGVISLIFQRFALLSHLSARENVMVPLRHRGGRGRNAMRREASDALGAVGMTGHENKRPRTLSGGEQQRVAIARALVTRPELILADEPTGALDAGTADDVMNVLVQQTQDRGSALVVVTHDDAVARGCDRMLHLDAGHLTVSDPPAAASCS